MNDVRDTLARLRAAITPTTRICALTGAGISAASGVPTFRGGHDSLWENVRPEELATPQAFERDPAKVWRWYDWRRGLVSNCEPNAAHLALVGLEAACERVTVVTQNVDGLHQRAGSRHVLEFHGSLWTLRCLGCGRETENHVTPLPPLPACSVCGGLMRPGVVWFGEAIDPQVMRDSVDAVGDCDLLLVIGTSGLVYPAAGLARAGKESGATVAEFNLEEGGVSAWVDHFIPGGAHETLPLLVPEV
ncbi:MAG TPA: NAD-dependent deacylase [Candidatus Krumholzibacteria bacterium]|nr:NAD-dependent deacylase [Candidatus Krumholzibacteria bacterium]HRX51218.1 NAD-dependent deacylase [Candidatus Krumholzibacteria bacterium]